VGIVRRNAGQLRLRVELNQPGLQLAGEMQNLNLISEPASRMVLQNYFPRLIEITRYSLFEGGQIAVRGIGRHIVHKRQMLLDVRRRPVAEELVQQALIAAIETAILHGELCDLAEGVHAGSEHEHAGVEAVRPADIRSSGQFLALEQLVAVLQDLQDGKGIIKLDLFI